MAIDLPEKIPSMLNNIRRGSSHKTIHRITKSLKPGEKSSFSFMRSKSLKGDQCRCCKDRLNKSIDASGRRIKSFYIERQNVDNNSEMEGEGDCEKNLLSAATIKTELNCGKVYEWNLNENEEREIQEKGWKESDSAKEKHFLKKQDTQTLLKAQPSELRKRRKKVFLLSSLGLILFSLAIFIRLFDPLEKILNWKLSLAPGSFVLDLWLAPPVTVYVKIYIFNFTNSDDFLAGKQKLKVQQLGPYVYAEQLENTNPIFHPNGTLSYIPKRTVSYVPEMSVANPESELVTVPNIPFLGLASMIADSSVFTNLAFITLTRYLGSQPFLNLTVHDYLWGYNDPLVSMANKIISTQIPFSRFGLLDRMYDEGENHITIRLADNGLQVNDKGYLPQYSIDTWNGSPGLSTWGYKPEDFESETPTRPEQNERCKLIRGASEGVLFPRNLSPKIVHQVFRKSFCRMIPLIFEKKGFAKNGIPGYWYKLPEDVFDTPEVNPAQACYCNPNLKTCLPKGLSDITPCYYNIPAAVSFPHFLEGDPKLLEDVEGLSPDKEKHGTSIVLQPTLGMPMEFQTRIQTNIIMKRIRYNARISRFSNIALPIVWIEMEMDGLPTYITLLLYLIVFIAPALITAIIVICFICGISLLIYSIIGTLVLEDCLGSRSRIKSKYSSIQISPVINKNSIINVYPEKAQLCLPLA